MSLKTIAIYTVIQKKILSMHNVKKTINNEEFIDNVQLFSVSDLNELSITQQNKFHLYVIDITVSQ